MLRHIIHLWGNWPHRNACGRCPEHLPQWTRCEGFANLMPSVVQSGVTSLGFLKEVSEILQRQPVKNRLVGQLQTFLLQLLGMAGLSSKGGTFHSAVGSPQRNLICSCRSTFPDFFSFDKYLPHASPHIAVFHKGSWVLRLSLLETNPGQCFLTLPSLRLE